MKKIVLVIVLLLLPFGVFAKEDLIYDMSIKGNTIEYSVNYDELINCDVESYISINNGYFFKVDSKVKGNTNIVVIDLNGLEIKNGDIIYLKMNLNDGGYKVKSNIYSNNPGVQYRYTGLKSMSDVLLRVRSNTVVSNSSIYFGYAIALYCLLSSGICIVLLRKDS